MRKVLIGLGVLIVLAIAAVLVAPSFVDWNGYKPEIAQRVKAATGRDLAIDGNISLSILPSPTLAVEQVRFANAEGGSAADMVSLDSLDVRVAFMPLLRGEIQVDSVTLVRPTILLETLADGRVNWELARPAGGAPDAAAPDTSGGTAGGTPAIRLDSVEIEDGTLIYRDAAAGSEERIEALDASISAGSLQGPFKAAGSARARDLPLDFEASSGAFTAGTTLPVSLSLSVPDTEAKLTFSGTVRPAAAPAAAGDEAGEQESGAAPAAAGTEVTGRLQAGGPNLARLIAALSPGAALPASLADSFAVDARVAYAAPFADLSELSLRLGETTATGNVTIDTGAPLYAKAALKLNRLDLDKLLAPAAGSGTDPNAAPDGTSAGSEAPPAPAAAGFALPRNVGGEIEVAIDAIGYRGGVVSDTRLSAALSDGAIVITRASALLPGGSDLAIAGTIETEGGQPRFAGAVEASSDNLRGLLDWLQAPMPQGVASDRLRKLSMTTRITATPAAVQVADIDLRVDASRVTGGIAIALPEAGRRTKPGFGIGLAIDKLNLDGYLGPVAAAGDAPPAAAGATSQAADAGAGTAPAGGLPLEALRPLAAFDANVELRVGSLTYHDQTMQGLHVDGTLQAGNLVLRDLSVQEFAGGKGALSGTFSDLAGDPRFDTRFDLSAGDAGRVLQFAGVDFPGRSKLGRLKLGGSLAGGRRDVAYDAAFSFGGIGAEGRAQGQVAGLGAGIPRIDSDISLTAKDAGPLLELAGVAGAVDAGLGALSLTGSAASGADDLTYDVSFSLSGVGGEGELSGRITAISSATPQVDTRLDLSARKPAGLLRLAGVDGDTAGKLGALGVKGTMAGGADAMRLDLDLAGLGGTAKVNGTVSAAPGQTPAGAQAISFDLTLDALHPELRQLLAAVAEDYRPAGSELGAFHFAAKAAGSTESASFTDLVVEAGANRLTGTMSYQAGTPGGRRPMVVAALTGNSLDLRGLMPADGKGGGAGGGGSGGGAGTGGGPWSREPLDLSALDAADADVDLTAAAVILEEARIDDLTAKLSLRDGILTITQLTGKTYGGTIDVNGQVASRGVPSASGTIVAANLDSGELVKAGFLGSRITGPVNVTADLNTLGVSMAEMVEGLSGTGNVGGTITVLTQAEQQIGSALLGILGSKVKEVRGITDTVNSVFAAFAGAPNNLSGDFVVTNGVLDTRNTRLENQNARLLATGQADLGAWTMDMLADIFAAASDDPYLSVALDGALGSPNAKFSGSAISGGGAGGIGGVLQQVVPGLPGGGTGTGAPSDSGLGGVLQQIVPGLSGQGTGSQAPTTTAPTTTAPSATGEPGALGTAPAPETASEPAPAEAPAAAEEAPTPAPAPEEAAPEEAAPEVAPEAAPSEAVPAEPLIEEPAPEPAPAEPAAEEPAPEEPVPGATGIEPAPGEAPPAAEEPVYIPPAEEEPAPAEAPQPGEPQPGEPQPAEPPATGQPGAVEPGAVEPGAVEPDAVEPGVQPESAEPGAGGAEPGAEGAAPGSGQPGLEELLPGLLPQ